MSTTPFLGLNKDALTDYYSVERVNNNSDIIDNWANGTHVDLSKKVDKTYIYVDDFKQSTDIDDTNAIQSAINYANSITDKPIIILSQRLYITSSPITLHSYTVLCGGYVNDEYKYKTVIQNTTTDIFTVTETTIIGYNLLSICFVGNLNNQLFVQQDYSTYFHKWGKINQCGFKNFKSIFGQIQFVGFRIYDCFMNSSYQIGTIFGSDNYFQQWFVGHQHDNSIRYDFSLVLQCPLTILRDIFFTGDLDVGFGPKSLLNIYGSHTYGVRIENCTFDYCDNSAIVCSVQARQIIINGNTFRGNLRANDSTSYTGVVAFHTAQNITVSENTFSHVHQGVENLTPIFYSFAGFPNYESRHIDIYGNHYEEDYVFTVDKVTFKDINIHDSSIIYDNQKALTISTAPSSTITVDYIDDILNTYTTAYSLSNFTGNLYNGKIITVYNFASTTITFTEGNFRNKAVADLVLSPYSAVRFVYRSNHWWEI